MNRNAARAFTLVELLTVVGIVVLLLAILLPVMQQVRFSGKKVLCASRLHQLTAACTTYLADNGTYPRAPLIDVQGGVLPHAVRISLINDLRSYLRYPKVDETATLDRLPAAAVCPFREHWRPPQFDAPLPLPGGAVIVTGYQYTAGLDSPENATGHILKPDHAPDARGRRRGVIWSDALGWYSGSGLVFLPPGATPSWVYFHISRAVVWTGLGAADSAALLGQHRAWTDGSVEWVDASYLDLRLDHRDQTAAYALGQPGSYSAHWWF